MWDRHTAGNGFGQNPLFELSLNKQPLFKTSCFERHEENYPNSGITIQGKKVCNKTMQEYIPCHFQFFLHVLAGYL